MQNIEKEHINLIFNEARKIIPDNLDNAHEWLGYLKEEALQDLPGWLKNLRGFIRGLWAAEVIELADLDDIDEALEKHGLI